MLFLAENDAPEKLINDGLENSAVPQNTPPWGAPVLFMGNKDLWPGFAYQKLNTITVNNKYPDTPDKETGQ